MATYPRWLIASDLSVDRGEAIFYGWKGNNCSDVWNSIANAEVILYDSSEPDDKIYQIMPFELLDRWSVDLINFKAVKTQSLLAFLDMDGT